MESAQNKRVCLSYQKCLYCRHAKKKCEPIDRTWPGKKCHRCDKLSLPCSDNHRAGEAFRQSIAVPTPLTSSTSENLEKVYISWTGLVYMASHSVHLYRSVKALEKRLQVIPNDGDHNSYVSVYIDSMKSKSEHRLEKLSQCAIFLRQYLVYYPGLLRNVDLCVAYISFLLKIFNGAVETSTIMPTDMGALAMQVEQCDRTVTGDYGFALLAQEIIILQSLSQDNTPNLPFQLWDYIKNHRNLRQLGCEIDELPPMHQLLLLTRSNRIIQAASDSGLLSHVMNERDILGRRFLEIALDAVPNPNIQPLLGFYTVPSEETDLFWRKRLHVACMNGCEDAVQWFLNNGDDPNAKGPMGALPLHIAIFYGYESLAFLLVRWKEVGLSYIDDSGRTYLQYAQWANFHSLARDLCF